MGQQQYHYDNTKLDQEVSSLKPSKMLNKASKSSCLLTDLTAELWWLLCMQPQVEAQLKPGLLFQTAKCFSRDTNNTHTRTAKHTYTQLHHKILWAASYTPTHMHQTQPDPPPLSLSSSFFVPNSLPHTLIHKMAALQFQQLAWNLWMRGQGQQWARRVLLLLFLGFFSLSLLLCPSYPQICLTNSCSSYVKNRNVPFCSLPSAFLQ